MSCRKLSWSAWVENEMKLCSQLCTTQTAKKHGCTRSLIYTRTSCEKCIFTPLEKLGDWYFVWLANELSRSSAVNILQFRATMVEMLLILMQRCKCIRVVKQNHRHNTSNIFMLDKSILISAAVQQSLKSFLIEIATRSQLSARLGARDWLITNTKIPATLSMFDCCSGNQRMFSIAAVKLR